MPSTDASRADPVVSLLAGLTTTSITVPPLAAWLLPTHGVDAAALTAVLGGSIVVTVAALGFSRFGGRIPVRVGSTPSSILLVLLPLAPLLLLVGWWLPRGARSLLVLGAFVGALTMFIFAFVSQTRHANAVTPDEAVTWEAGLPASLETRLRHLGIVLLVVGTGMLVGGAVTGTRPVQYVGQLVVPIGVVTATTGTRTSEYAASDAGLTRRAPVHAVTRPWTRFRGYEVTEDAIVLHRARRYRWLPAVRFARDDIADEDAVRSVLAERLDQL